MANPIKTPGIISSVTTHDQGVYTVTISPEKRIPRFKPGQFLHLTIDNFDPQGGFWPESRVFSIASAPSNSEIEIIYSVKGRYTTRMSKEILVGKQVWLKLPYGDFSIETLVQPNQDIILVAGGTGISPFISYLRDRFSNSTRLSRRIHLIYGIRKLNHLLYCDTLQACASNLPHFSIDLFIENDDTPPIPKSIKVFKGMISLEHISTTQKMFNTPVYFLSGPPAMIQAFKTGLLSSGTITNNIKIDEWE
jgi:NAD(P)H-flavin reductase